MKTALKKIKLKNMDKKTEEIFKASTVAVLLENVNDNFKLLAEGLMGVQRQVDNLTDEVHSFRDETNVRLAQVDARFDRMGGELEEIKSNQQITLDHLFNTEEKFEVMEKELKEIKLELIRLNKNMLFPEERKALFGRVDILERDMEKFRIFMNTQAGLKSV